MSALDSGQSPQSVDIETNLAQIIFDALRQLVREEIDAAALKHAGIDRCDKEGYALAQVPQ